MIENRPKSAWLTASRCLVILQFVTATALVLSVRISWKLVPWMSVSAIGIILGLWAIAAIGPTRVAISPEVKPNAKLVTAGPYRFLRHPMYTALLLFCGGFVFTAFHWWKVIAWCVLLIVLLAKSGIEERQLTERFAEYQDYARRTRRFVPFIW